MKKLLLLPILLYACTPKENSITQDFSTKSISNEEWATYEGKWIAEKGIISLELALQKNPPGVNSYYKLHESLVEAKRASGTYSRGTFSIYHGLPNDEFGIRLHDLSPNTTGVHFRVKQSRFLNLAEEMFFITRGNNELIPCDENFNPITTDRKHTLHKRIDYITVEGYITFDRDSAHYYERNTSEYWKVAELGEYDSLEVKYKQMTTENYEGLYLKALAYSISDSTALNGKALVIKRIKALGNDPD